MDDLVEQACLYLTTKSYPEGCTLIRKRQIRKKAEKFSVVNGELYYVPKEKQVCYIHDFIIKAKFHSIPVHEF